MKVIWIDNMTEAMVGVRKAMDNAVKEIGKQTAYDIIGVPHPSRWQRIRVGILEFIIKRW